MTTTRQRLTRQLSGQAKSRYLRSLIENAGAGPEVSAKVDGEIVSVLVKGSPAERQSGLASHRARRARANEAPAQPVPGLHSIEPAPQALTTSIPPVAPSPAKMGKQTRGKAKNGATVPNAKTSDVTTPPAPAAQLFNPYGFSAMAVLLNEGRPALEARLAQVATRDQFLELAQAQSVRIDPDVLANQKAGLEVLRRAFIDAVQLRIAHRRAVSGE